MGFSGTSNLCAANTFSQLLSGHSIEWHRFILSLSIRRKPPLLPLPWPWSWLFLSYRNLFCGGVIFSLSPNRTEQKYLAAENWEKKSKITVEQKLSTWNNLVLNNKYNKYEDELYHCTTLMCHVDLSEFATCSLGGFTRYSYVTIHSFYLPQCSSQTFKLVTKG